MVVVALVSVALALELVHVPVVEAQAGEEVRVVVLTDDIGAMPSVELVYRSGGSWKSLGFGPDDRGNWTAVIPGDEVRGPSLEYTIVSPSGQHFASREVPWVVTVETQDLSDVGERELARHDGQRSTAEGWYRRIDHGADGGLNDATWMAGVTFVYRPLTAVRTMQFGFVRMRGEALKVSGRAEQDVPIYVQDTNEDVNENAGGQAWSHGLDWGYADIETPLSERVGLSGRLILGGNDAGFTAGGGVALRVGLEPEVYGRVWLRGVMGTGVDAGFQMNWDTVPYVPMFASIEVTNWPNARPWGVLLSYGVALSLGEHADLGLRVGYQGRTSDLGGLGMGASLAWSF